MMEQLILHLTGDYLTQTDWMARNKTRSTWAAFVHATVYSVPFFLIGSWQAVFVIWSTHLVIDRFGLARYVVFAKNKMTEPGLSWGDVRETGFPKDTPEWMSIMLLVIADNTLHLAINFAALKWL